MFAFYEIRKDEYDNLKCPCLFEFDGDRTYAKIEFDGDLIKFAYSTIGVALEIMETGNDEIIIGVDLDVCIYNRTKKSVVLHIKPICFFCEFLRVKDKLIVFAELDVYLINLNTHEIEMEFSYPDVYTTYESDGNMLKMNYIEGGETSVDLSKFLS
ncbi:MAG: hypothetical protein J5875_10745 [Paludibacteraceae bacterium]|nr:hypothetical protein [Paludibacteraceae bacterium]